MMSFTSHIRLLAAGAHAAVGQKYGKEWEVFRTAYRPPDLAPGIDTRWSTLVAEYDRLIGGPAR